MARFGILVGGGPAAGINGVIAAATTVATRRGHSVIGILDGFKWVMQGRTDRTLPLDEAAVAGLHLRGGSILHTARANPTKQPEHLENCVKAFKALGIDRLITIGGDDTATSASCVAAEAGGHIHVAHVPKTIDNDLPLPDGIATFGYETAREQATAVIERILNDAHATQRWFFVVVMGRQAGHLALGAAKAAGAPVCVIPEEFKHRPIKLDDVVRVLEGTIVKRRALGRQDGVAVIAEGVMEYMDPDDPHLRAVPRDEHGHLRLAEIPIATVLRTAVADSLAERGVAVAIAEKDVGYELRSGYPTAFDRDYTLDLGVGAVQLLLDGETGVLVTRQAGRIVPVPFADIIDPETRRSRTRAVAIDSAAWQTSVRLQDRVVPEDLADAERLAAIAKQAGLSPEAARERYAPR
ncbi:MAG: 6-phosphofructokinase [Deltaproteobacteria bacterium]|nr:6-phosphofructokinase [Deltaproteobacteria bacterium]MBW2362559.1 6-phosphofructokinase [Deltaproteobacteria bacterium]